MVKVITVIILLIGDTWMWANKEMVDFIEWLKSNNDSLNTGKQNKVGLYGLDLICCEQSH